MFLCLQETLRGEEGCRSHQVTELCSEIILGRLLAKGALERVWKELWGLGGCVCVCMWMDVGETQERVSLEVPRAVWDHAWVPQDWGVAAQASSPAPSKL